MKQGRLSVLARGNGHYVLNTVGRYENLCSFLADRIADGQAFPSERVVRLPRRKCKLKPWENLNCLLLRLEWEMSDRKPRW